MDGQEQNRPEGEKIQAPERLQTPFLKKLENFWYHYKWPAILAAFLVVTVLVCTLQMCSRVTYDCHALYAGDGAFSSSVQAEMQQSLQQYTQDFNGDGEKNVSLVWYVISDDPKLDASSKTVIVTNRASLDNEVMAGEALLCFVSPAVFEDWDAIREDAEDGTVVRMLTELYLLEKDVADSAYYRDSKGNVHYTGVLLRETALVGLPGFNALPKDTVVCLRKPSALASLFGSDRKQQQAYEQHKTVLTAILQSCKES